MANEFKVRNGLIVTGSEYVSESIFAPNLPPETTPAYYVTWRQSDGRFEVSQLTPGNTANTIGCWDSITSGDPAGAEMCLGIAAAAPTNQNCVTYKGVTSKALIDSTTGGGMFINTSGGTSVWSLTTNSTTEYINVNDTDLNGVSTKNFFGGVALGQTITLASGTNSATYTVTYANGSGTNYLIGVKMTSNSNFTLTSGTSFTICI